MGATQIAVRALELTDLDDVFEIFACPSVVANTTQLPHQSRDRLATRFFPVQDGTYMLAAEVDGRVVGMLGLHGNTRPRTRHAAGIGMSVHEAYQGRGVGAALMVAVLDLADRWLNLRRIELQVYTDNAAAIHLYEKFGFVTEGTLRDYVFRDGVYVDAYAMARLRR